MNKPLHIHEMKLMLIPVTRVAEPYAILIERCECGKKQALEYGPYGQIKKLGLQIKAQREQIK